MHKGNYYYQEDKTIIINKYLDYIYINKIIIIKKVIYCKKVK